MKKALVFCLALFLIFSFTSCAKNAAIKRQIDTDLKTYYELDDGTYQCENRVYKYRLEVTGRMHSAAKDSTFVYLSNLKEIPFDRAWKAAGLSSDTNDYFAPEEAILIEIK